MRLTILALILAIAALGLGSFATFTSLFDDEAPPVAVESGWTDIECLRADTSLNILDIGCIRGDDCAPYADMIQAINDNCP